MWQYLQFPTTPCWPNLLQRANLGCKGQARGVTVWRSRLHPGSSVQLLSEHDDRLAAGEPYCLLVFAGNRCILDRVGSSRVGRLLFSQRSNVCIVLARGCTFNTHSQTTATRQPAPSNAEVCLTSLSTFLANFDSHESTFEEGFVQNLHSGCRCQKQPCMKTIALYFFNTMSGLPGRFATCFR